MKSRTVDPATLRRGDRIRFGSRKAVYTFQRFEEKADGKMWLSVYGPLEGSPSVEGFQVVYVGPKTTTRISLIDGKRHKLRPEQVRLVRAL